MRALRRMLPPVAAAAATLAAALASHEVAAQPASPIVLQPHRAVYEITLDKIRGGGGIADLTGRMVFELTGNICEGYTQNMRFVTRTTSQDGTVSVNDMRSSSWESGGADSFRFSSSQYRDEKLSEATQGDARRQPGQQVAVELSKPQRKKLSVPNGALFPVQHSLRLLEAADQGRPIFTVDLYDGSEKGEKVYATTAIIGSRQVGLNRSLPKVKNAEVLDGMASWPVSMSYFDQANLAADAVPTYELAFQYFANGISRRLFIDYGDFSIRGELKDLMLLERGKCDPAKRG